jgi:hypothetical protein
MERPLMILAGLNDGVRYLPHGHNIATSLIPLVSLGGLHKVRVKRDRVGGGDAGG